MFTAEEQKKSVSGPFRILIVFMKLFLLLLVVEVLISASLCHTHFLQPILNIRGNMGFMVEKCDEFLCR